MYNPIMCILYIYNLYMFLFSSIKIIEVKYKIKFYNIPIVFRNTFDTFRKTFVKIKIDSSIS